MMKRNVFFVVMFTLFIVAAFASRPGSKMVNIDDLDLSGEPGNVQSNGDLSQVKPNINFGNIPLYFIANNGQVNENARFYAKASRYTLWMTKEGFVFDSLISVEDVAGIEASPGDPSNPSPRPVKMERNVSRLFFLDANNNPEMVALDEAALKVNYFIGNDRTKWNCAVPTSQSVLYKELYNNVDLKVYGIERQIEYDWIVKPGGDPGAISFRYKNVKGTRIDNEGNLLIETDHGELMHKRPFSYPGDS